MKEVKLEKLFLVGQDDTYPGLFIDPKIFLKDVPLGAALSMACNILYHYSERRRDDSEFQSRHLIQWMMKMENQDKISISNFVQQNSPLVLSPSFNLIDRRPFLNLIQHILVYSRPGNDQLSSGGL